MKNLKNVLLASVYLSTATVSSFASEIVQNEQNELAKSMQSLNVQPTQIENSQLQQDQIITNQNQQNNVDWSTLPNEIVFSIMNTENLPEKIFTDSYEKLFNKILLVSDNIYNNLSVSSSTIPLVSLENTLKELSGEIQNIKNEIARFGNSYAKFSEVCLNWNNASSYLVEKANRFYLSFLTLEFYVKNAQIDLSKWTINRYMDSVIPESLKYICIDNNTNPYSDEQLDDFIRPLYSVGHHMIDTIWNGFQDIFYQKKCIRESTEVIENYQRLNAEMHLIK